MVEEKIAMLLLLTNQVGNGEMEGLRSGIIREIQTGGRAPFSLLLDRQEEV